MYAFLKLCLTENFWIIWIKIQNVFFDFSVDIWIINFCIVLFEFLRKWKFFCFFFSLKSCVVMSPWDIHSILWTVSSIICKIISFAGISSIVEVLCTIKRSKKALKLWSMPIEERQLSSIPAIIATTSSSVLEMYRFG